MTASIDDTITSLSPAVGHRPVMLDAAITGLNVKPDGVYIDGTFGGGGHSKAILNQLSGTGEVIAFDLDPEAISRGEQIRENLSRPDQLTLVHRNFAEIGIVWSEWQRPLADGVLLDLGLSSFQLDTPARGFSFGSDGPLDMRFDSTGGASAFELVNTLGEADLAEILWKYGDEHRSRRIAAAIVKARKDHAIQTTTELAKIVERSVGGRKGMRTHPATQTFQAIRIAVNDELESLETALRGATDILAPGGRLVVIAFHSLEDRIVKQFMQRESSQCICPPDQPVCTCHHQPTLRPVGKKHRSSESEVATNPRSRSAILRVAEKVPVRDSR